MRLKLFVSTVAVLFAGITYLGAHVAAQTPQEPSIADAARLNREQKKSAPKPGTVITNDTLAPSPSSATPAVPPAAPTGNPQPAVTPDSVTQAATPTSSHASEASPQPEPSKEDTERLKAEITAIKQELKDKQNEVDLLQRLLNLDREALLSKPDPSHDVQGKAKIDAEQDDLNQKMAEFEKLKAKLQGIAPELTTTQTPPKS